MRKNLKTENFQPDGIDARLLSMLEQNARISVAEMARNINMSSPSVNERLKRLEESGLIEGYRTELNAPSLGYPMMAIVRMRNHTGKLQALEQLILTIPEIIECDKITGEDCFFARICFKDMEHLDGILETLSELSDTNTSIVKTTPVKRRNAPVNL